MALSLADCKFWARNKIADTISLYFGKDTCIGIDSKIVHLCLKRGVFSRADLCYSTRLSDKLTKVQLILAADKAQVMQEVPEEAEHLFAWAEKAATKDKREYKKAYASVLRHIDEANLEKLGAFSEEIKLIGQNYLVERSSGRMPAKKDFIGRAPIKAH